MKTIQIESFEIRVGAEKTLEHSFSFGLFYNSSESRSLSYGRVMKEKSVDYAVLVNFDGGENENKKKNLEKNKSLLERIAKQTITIECDQIYEYLENLNSIVDSIPQTCLSVGARFFIDMTGAPLIYSSAIVKYLLRLFPKPELWVLNASGIYQKRGEEQFAEGVRKSIFIPGFYGIPKPSLPMRYIFLVGYDGERSLNIYRENLPDYVSVIIPDPGYEKENANNTISNNAIFLKEVGFRMNGGRLENNADIHRISIWNVQGVLDIIKKIYEESRDREQIRLVPLGPKPHALAAALAGTLYNDISIMYQVPKKYYLSEVKLGDKIYFYRINAT